MQRRVERAMLHLQEIVRCPLNMFPDLMAVSRSVKERSQDEHVKRALQKSRAFWCFTHGRHSTLIRIRW
jgi:hypothetical protein